MYRYPHNNNQSRSENCRHIVAHRIESYKATANYISTIIGSAQEMVSGSASEAVAARDALLAQLRTEISFDVPADVVDNEIKQHLEAEGKADDAAHAEEIALVRSALS